MNIAINKADWQNLKQHVFSDKNAPGALGVRRYQGHFFLQALFMKAV